MSELRERIAKALFDAFGDGFEEAYGQRPVPEWDATPLSNREEWYEDADALVGESEPKTYRNPGPCANHGVEGCVACCEPVCATCDRPLYRASPTPTPHTYSGGHCIRCDAPEECRPSGARTVGRASEGGTDPWNEPGVSLTGGEPKEAG